MLPDADELYESLTTRNGQYEGLAFVCVKTTGIFCRLTCPARVAKRENVVFRASVADCVAAGFRACKRCKPEQIGPDQAASPFAGNSSVTAS
jgi:AraC family transcriptional regulator of adaptative response/methylated-DNA-[protein]-cysteine methyltransferase